MLYFESENELKFYNLEACATVPAIGSKEKCAKPEKCANAWKPREFGKK